jgi:hypothetical protein
LLETRGAASAKGFGLTASTAAPVFVEDVFSTWLYTGNSSTQTITNGIDLSTKGGLVWIKSRNNASGHAWFDTNRGPNKIISSQATFSQTAITTTNSLNTFNSNGFTLGSDTDTAWVNDGSLPYTYASWTFRKQPKFFDVVTYTGDNTNNRQISHNLGSAPGFIIVKNITNAQSWVCYHRSLGTGNYIFLNSTGTSGADANAFPTVTDTYFVPTADQSAFALNTSGSTFVAYLFAHNAGGFGLTGTDNVISCGSWTDSGSGTQTITLGYEPQFVIYKRSDGSTNWVMLDTMRGWPVVNAAGSTANLYPNLSNAESGGNYAGNGPTATGFNMPTLGGGTYIYIAIRRGPMKTPTTGTSVYENVAYTGNATANRQIGSSVLMDAMLLNNRDATAQSWSTYGQMFFDRLRGDNVLLATASTSAESTGWQTYFDSDMNAGWDTSTTTSQDYLNKSGATFVSHIFRRAPGFFDVVCFSTDGSGQYSGSHNLGVTPELLIFKTRGVAANWQVVSNKLTGAQYFLRLNSTIAEYNNTNTNYTATSTAFTIPNTGFLATSATYVAYLFASCPGVSKVGSYVGNGTTDRVIDCGFTSGARFVLLKKTSTTSDWYVYDTARGISSSGESSLSLNTTAAESGVADVIDPASVGFSVGTSGSDFFNESGVSYIFLAIA